LVDDYLIVEDDMVLKRKIYTPQEYIQVGMGFFLVGMFADLVADGRLIGTFFAELIPSKSLLDAIHGVAAGVSIPIFCISIFFNLRGLSMLRSR
jgi:hypothetical protein